MPTLLSKALSRMNMELTKASRGTLSTYVINAPPQFGQPLPLSGDVQGLITMERMREVSMKTPTVSACVNAILDYASVVPITVRGVDPSKKVSPKKRDLILSYINRPNPDMNGLSFRQMLFRDMIVCGMGAVEIEWDENGYPANLHVLDIARLRIDFAEGGSILGYDMLNARGMPISNGTPHAWNPEDIILFSMNPVSQSRYPISHLSQLFSCALIEDLMLTFIAGRFTESNMPFGVYDLGEITEDELQYAIAKWNDQASSGHKIMLTGSKGGAKWSPFGYHLKDLEATDLLNAVRDKIKEIMGVTDNELGDSDEVSKSNGYNLSETFKKRGVGPVLSCFTSGMSSRFVQDSLGFMDIELGTEEIDARDDIIQSEVDNSYWKIGVISTNDIRNRMGKPSAEGGDELFVTLGQNAIPLRLLSAMSEAQLMAVLMMTQQEGQAGGMSGVDPPLIRGPQFQMRFTTPDGAGSSTPKFRYPSPTGQQPRGRVQTMRSAGVRTEHIKGKD